MDVMKKIGLAIVLLSVAILFIIVPLSFRIAENEMTQCTHESQACQITGHIPLESYAGIMAAIALAGFGSFIMFKSRVSEKLNKELTKKIKESEKKLDGDEKKIYHLLAESDGALFQSEITDKSNFTKTKVTRLLDKLEAKGMVERRRRGMTNMILIKK